MFCPAYLSHWAQNSRALVWLNNMLLALFSFITAKDAKLLQAF